MGHWGVLLFLALSTGSLSAYGEARVKPQTYHSSYGVEFHALCFRPEVMPLKRAKVTLAIETWMQDVFGKVSTCASHYPELWSPYLQEWFQRLQDATVLCSSKSSTQLGHSGLISFDRESLASNLTPQEISMIGELEPSLESPVLILSADTFRSAISSPWGDRPESSIYNVAQYVFMHEMFHATSANNRIDHNKLRNILPRTNEPCSDDVTIDRVTMISALCSGHKINDKTAVKILSSRMIACGPDKGCTQTFNTEKNNLGFFEKCSIPSHDLSDEQAQSLRRRIEKKSVY